MAIIIIIAVVIG